MDMNLLDFVVEMEINWKLLTLKPYEPYHYVYFVDKCSLNFFNPLG